jgi:hypothetical protein
VLGFCLQERSTVRRDRHAQQVQQRQELRQVFVRFLARLAAMRRLQNERSVLREAGASEAEQVAAKAAALEARTAVGVVLYRAPAADRRPVRPGARRPGRRRHLHPARGRRPDRPDRRGDLARAAHIAFVAAAGPLVRA